jgi:hypothetical protein
MPAFDLGFHLLLGKACSKLCFSSKDGERTMKKRNETIVKYEAAQETQSKNIARTVFHTSGTEMPSQSELLQWS